MPSDCCRYLLGFRRMPMTFHLLSLCFFIVDIHTQALTNVALNKPATQSSTHGTHGRPQAIVDGNKNSDINFCTTGDNPDLLPDRWWRVDLEGMFEVAAVVITNRGGCCGDRTADFDVLVSRALPDPLQGWPDNSAVCLHRGPAIGTGATLRLDCTQPVTGRYVTWIRTNYAGPFNFCEIEVLALPVPDPIHRTADYNRFSDHKAPGDVIRETGARSVIHCTSTCSKEEGCNAVNMKAGPTLSQGERRPCQLLAYDVSSHPSALQPFPGWNFCLMKRVEEILP